MNYERSEHVNYMTEELKKTGYRINTLVSLAQGSAEELESDYNDLIKEEVQIALALVVQLWCDFSYPATLQMMTDHLKELPFWKSPLFTREKDND